MDLERDHQLAALGLIVFHSNCVGGVIKAGDVDRVVVTHRNSDRIRIECRIFGPVVRAVIVVFFYCNALQISILIQDKIKGIGYRVLQNGGRIRVYRRSQALGNVLENVVEISGVGGRFVISCVAAIAKCNRKSVTTACRSRGIVGGHGVHIFVDVFLLDVRRICPLHHTDGVDGHTRVLHSFGLFDSVNSDIVIKAIPVVGLAVCEEDHNFVSPFTAVLQCSLCATQTVIGRGRASVL